ncbi:hypothetical protein H4K36_33665 [Streptomyces sp. DHE7-1]|nr:hypothetical protein [Streptomyces sp. DHE7-1]
MAEYLTVLLTGMTTGSRRPPARLPLLGPDRREQVLHTWNDTATELPGTTVAALFAAQVDRTPDAVALEAGTSTSPTVNWTPAPTGWRPGWPGSGYGRNRRSVSSWTAPPS